MISTILLRMFYLPSHEFSGEELSVARKNNDERGK